MWFKHLLPNPQKRRFSLPRKLAKPTEYLLTSVISATHQKEKQDGCGAMGTTATKIAAGFASLSLKTRIDSGARNTASTKMSAFTVIQK